MIQELVAKRPDAPEKEPINLDVEINLQALEPAEREKWERLNDYGVGEVTIGGRALESFAVRGPEWIAGEREVQRLEARSLFRGSKPISVLAFSGGPTPVASVEGAIVSAGPGFKGSGLVIETPGGLTISFLISTSGADGSVELQFNPVGCDAREAKRTLDFVTSLDDGSRIDLRQGTTTRMSANVTTTGARPEDAFVDQLIDDLAFISMDMHTPIVVPDSLSAAERLEIRRLRLILDGYAVLEPEFGTLSVTLNGRSSREYEDRLSGGFALALTTDSIAYGFLGLTFQLQELCVFHPQVHLEDAATMVEALRSGQAAGMTATIGPIPGGPFWAYLPERMNRLGRPRRPVMLDVPGHSEPPLPEFPETQPQA